jgi:hypothetical protein
MCCSTASANFEATKILLNETSMPGVGRVHVLLYQNAVVSYAGPNAMLLHIPSAALLGPENFISTTDFPSVLDDMVTAVSPPLTRGISAGPRAAAASSVQVFESGIYHVVLARNAAEIPAALDRVPPEKRPPLNQALFDFYARAFGDSWHVALCCFNTERMAEAPPLMLWYPPLASEDGRFRLPALDCHTGDIPDLHARVDVDHWLFVASDEMEGGRGVYYTNEIPEDVRCLLPDRVHGAYFARPMPNGDFVYAREQVMEGKIREPQRMRPPAFAAA